MIRTLAEPNLTAISGESANFLAGGEFPVPGGYTVRPADPRLSARDPVQEIRRRPQLHAGRAVGRPHQPEGDDRSVRAVDRERDPARAGHQRRRPFRRSRPAAPRPRWKFPPAVRSRMAGMIQEQTKQTISGLPGLMQVPVLGTLFKSRDYVNRQTELVVIVTPYIVRAVAQKDLSRPDDGFADSVRSRRRPARPAQPHLRHAPGKGPARGLSRQVRLHSGLMDAHEDQPMNKTSTPRARRSRSSASRPCWPAARRRRRTTRSPRASRTTIACATRSRCASKRRR